MMVYVRTLADQWLLLSLLVGVAMVGVIFLTYWMLWTPRPAPVQQVRRFRVLYALPWVFILTVVGLTVLFVAMTVSSIRHPPNW